MGYTDKSTYPHVHTYTHSTTHTTTEEECDKKMRSGGWRSTHLSHE